MSTASARQGNTLLGFVAGLVIGLLIAVGVALYLTNAPVPFVNKVTRPTENIKPGADGKLPDPNKPLYGNPPPAQTAEPAKDAKDAKGAPAPAASGKAATPPKAETAPTTTTTTTGEDGSRYVVQAGAFKSADDADGMKARLALLGLDARVFPIEQAGTTLYRVRLGPYGQMDDINKIRKTLTDNGIESQVIRLK